MKSISKNIQNLGCIFVFLITSLGIAQNYKQIKAETITYKKIDSINLKLHVYKPLDFDANKTYNCIVFFHGGGWNSGNHKAFRRQAQYLASRGMIAISADYRIKNKHNTTPFEAVEDAKSAIRFVRKNAKSLHINPNKIAAGGGSAGGHLAAACGNIEGLEGDNEDLSISSKPNALVLFNPVYDNSKNGFGYRRMNGRHLEISPLHNITKGAPPTIVFFGTKDKTTPVASSKAYEKRMNEVGSRCDLFLYEGQEHSFFNRGKYFIKTLYETDVFLASLGYLQGKPSIVATQNRPKGTDLVNKDKLPYLRTKGDFSKITASKKNKTVEFLIETIKEPKFIYNCATSIPIEKKSYPKETVFLLSYQAKTVSASLETGEAKLLWLFKQLKSYKGNISSTQSISSEWQTYYIPFQANQSIDKKDLAIVMQYGFRPQSFLIKNIKFEVFPKGTKLAKLPKTKIKYAGMEANAEWRTLANQRIEAIRKGNFTVEFTKNGKPVTNKTIQIELKKHLFPFGARMAAKDIVENTNDYKNFKKAFNSLVLGNDLKIKHWQREDKRETTLEALEILEKDGFPVKGHVLVWPGFRYLPKSIQTHKDNPEKVTQIIENHVNSVLEATKGKITHWDVVNEAYTNQDVQKITGSETILYDAFKIAAEKQPKARRFTNEYGIISKGGTDTQKQQWYYDFIKRIDKNTNGLLQGIGIQSHIGSDLTPPERVLEILSYYATLGKQISISEFTMDIQDAVIREQYTRDFMIAAFSHPNVVEFLFWGNTEDGRNKCDIFTEENEIGIMGKAFFSLVHNAWKTTLNGTTSNAGLITGRGFYGEYEYSFVEDGKVKKGTFVLKPRGERIIKIEL
ncbi:endo-1,4-beta-xylanase [uncultured Kordia sp.]|uniref:endo-1,4-beta-xylanase n=1 Tax=uncultured Kordia sp. TaxID=507699 RepID=UPI002621A67C|nr:endo-1,4-beta-xylanase [uncultured Kordia sp.]